MSNQVNNSEKASPPLPWYKDGLRFQCTECGKCCTGSPGYVWVNEKDIAGMAEFLKISIELFKRKYLRLRHQRYALVEKKSQNNACIFLEGKKCMVYKARPIQCRTFPWWDENLNNEESWKLAGLNCEGINDQAPLVPYAKIEEQLHINRQNQ